MRIEQGEFFGGNLEEIIVKWRDFRIGIGPVGKKRKTEVFVGIGEIMSFQLFELPGDFFAVIEKGRNNNKGFELRRNAVFQIQARQVFWTKPGNNHAVHDCNADLGSRKQRRKA